VGWVTPTKSSSSFLFGLGQNVCKHSTICVFLKVIYPCGVSSHPSTGGTGMLLLNEHSKSVTGSCIVQNLILMNGTIVKYI
jgi:hypothetical protein